MSEPDKIQYLTPEEYLRFEEKSDWRHEYVRGQIFAMTGASKAHNLICTNLIGLLYSGLKGSGCRVYSHDMKVNIATNDCFYYPDIMVTCDTSSTDCEFEDSPKLIIEILSHSTKHIDKREKLVAYRQIGSLLQYVLVHQDRVLVESYNRISDKEWTVSKIKFPDANAVTLSAVNDLSFLLSDIYDGVDFVPLVKESEEEFVV